VKAARGWRRQEVLDKKNIWGPGSSSFGRQQRLSEITTEPIKNLRGLGTIRGPVLPALA